jgi:hypothetical protein
MGWGARGLNIVVVASFLSACTRGARTSAELQTTSLEALPAAENPLQLSDLPFPEAAQRLKLFDTLVAHIERLDGEALDVRRDRERSWSQSVAQLRQEMAKSTSFIEMARVLSRLDATYTNLHSRIEFVAEGDWNERGRVRPGFEVVTRVSPEANTSFHLRVRDKDIKLVGGLQEGDEVVKINGRTMDSWARENFEFCKYPLRMQCDQELFENLLQETLSWRRGDSLKLSLRNSRGRERRLDVPYAVVADGSKEREDRDKERRKLLECAREESRYPGFAQIYAGNRACIYEKIGDTSTAVLRISSFSYREDWMFPTQKLRSVRQEVDALEPFWQLNSERWAHLVIDLADNTGGNAPIPYYQLLFTEPFQEQYYRLKKVAELDDPEFFKELLWNDPVQYATYSLLKSEGAWDAVAIGEYLPQIPMFCLMKHKDCRESRFRARPHPFKGRMSLLTNRSCISSCDGFVWALKNTFGDRVQLVGQPHAADSTYSRARLDVEWDEEIGFRIRTRNERSPVSSKTLFSQVLALSQSTDQGGVTLSGRPLPMDVFVGSDPLAGQPWRSLALSAALERSRPETTLSQLDSASN